MRICSTILATALTTSIIACSEPASLGVAEQELDTSALFYENFTADGFDTGECGGTTGVQAAPMGSWTSNVFIDTDDRRAGCRQQFAVTDPEGVLSSLSLAVNFFADGDAGQCKDSGLHAIPVTNSTSPSWGTSYGIDTDQRPGGCRQVFSVSGRADIALDVQFVPTGDGGQCGNAGQQTATSRRDASFRIDTDGRPGGCNERFRLRRMSCGDGICDPDNNEDRTTCPSDCESCGDGVCGPTEPGHCAEDCPVCNDGVCGAGEIFTCPSDCGICDTHFCEL
jgi:hypothetical protein